MTDPKSDQPVAPQRRAATLGRIPSQLRNALAGITVIGACCIIGVVIAIAIKHHAAVLLFSAAGWTIAAWLWMCLRSYRRDERAYARALTAILGQDPATEPTDHDRITIVSAITTTHHMGHAVPDYDQRCADAMDAVTVADLREAAEGLL